MKLNKKGIELLHHFEGCKLTAYQCSAKVWTIGWGNTQYENGAKVRQGDKITQERADELFLNVVTKFSQGVEKLLTQKVNENQFSALVSFAYNAGLGNLQRSTLLRLVNANPNDEGIRDQFMRWNKAGGKELAGLTRRRKAEADLYFTA
jgi:lysozyme